MTSISHQKPLKSKNKKHRIFCNTKFYHPAKFELKRIKNAKVVPRLQPLRPIGPPCLHEGKPPQAGEVTRLGGVTRLSI